MRDKDFVYASTYIRTLENKMLERSDFEALIEAPSLRQALALLSGKGYGNRLAGQGPGEEPDAEALLNAELAYTWDEVKGACPKDAPIHILLYQNDFQNLKTILKATFSGIEYESFEPLILGPFTMPPDAAHRAVREGKAESLPDIFKKPAEEAYRILARDGDGQFAEIVLDKALYSAMGEAAVQIDNDFLAGWVDLNISVMNMKIALRGLVGGKSRAFLRDSMLECKGIDADALADAAAEGASAVIRVITQSGFEEAANEAAESAGSGGSGGTGLSPGKFERCCDKALIRYARTARQKLFGFETVLGFFICKQFELKAARIVLSGLRGGVPAGVLRERLSALYV